MQDLPQQGSIADVFLPRLIARLHRDGFEGAMRVTLGATTKIIYYKRGEIASAASNAESDRLANLLIAAERLSQAQLDMAKSRLQPGGSLGKTLIEMGFLTPNELLLGARQQVREILGSCFALSRGDYQVEPGPLPREVTVLGLPAKRLIFDAVLQMKDRQSIIREMGSMESVYRPTEDLQAGLGVLKLDVEMDRIGRMLDGLSTLRDISGRTALDDFTVGKVVLALDLLGLADAVRPAAAPEPGGRTIAITGEEEAALPEPVLAGPPDPAFLGAEESVAGDDEPLPSAAAHEGPGSSPGFGEKPPAPADAAAADLPEPPPIPDEELPPFAFQPGEEPQWTIDPKTGERVHVGPIEMTFDGRVSSGPGSGRRLVRLLALAGGLILVLGASFLYLYLRRSTRQAVVRLEAPAESPASAAGAEPAPAPASPVGAEALPALEPRGEASPAASPAAIPEPEPSREAPPAAVRPPPRPAGAPPGPPPHGSISPFRDSTRYIAALGIFDMGDPARAAEIFGDLVAAENSGRYTLQLMIACEVDTLRTARADSGEHGSLYFLPYSLKGRDCYRACWGSYPSKEAALAAADGLPEPFTRSGRPVAIPLARLRPSS